MKQTKDNVMPPDHGRSWEFDRSVTEAYFHGEDPDDMLLDGFAKVAREFARKQEK